MTDAWNDATNLGGFGNPDATANDGEQSDAQPFGFTDNRKINPETGEARAANLSDSEVNARIQGLDFTPEGGDFEADEAAAGAAASAQAANPQGAGGDLAAELAAAKAEAAQNLDSYQRSQADYINLRNRTTKQLETMRADGREDVFRALLPALDQIERARSHGELTGPMETIAGQIDDALAKMGFTRYGAVGDEFSPHLHEALMHRTSPDQTAETVEHVIDPGYLNGEKVVRPAKVGVIGPE